MSIAERYREYARVIDMCEGTGVHPWSCVKYMGENWLETKADVRLNLDGQGDYTFAVAIVAGKPMFVGDVVISDGMQLTFTSKTKIDVNPDPRTWNKPKRTFKLAGRELPVPKTAGVCHTKIGNVPYYFDTAKNKVDFELGVYAAITEAIENERLQNK